MKMSAIKARSKYVCALGLLPLTLIALFAARTANAQFRNGIRRGHALPRYSHPYRANHAPRAKTVHAAGSDPRAIKLLFQTFNSHVFYSGVQQTQVGGQISVQKVMGGPQGRLRIEYVSPPRFAGDIMVTAPSVFLHYISKRQRTYVTKWPAGKRQRIASRLRALVRNGKLQVTQTGWQQIAGVNCTIVRLARVPASAPGGITQRQLWIDPANAVILRNERWSPSGIQSVSYFTSITIGAASGVTMRDFTMASLPSNPHKQRIIHQSTRVMSLPEAEHIAGIHVLLPGYLPAGYRENGVWTVHRGRLTGILIRYSAGVNHFTLFEHRILRQGSSRPRPPIRPRAGVQTWRQASLGQVIAITYIGSLAPSEQLTMERSFR